MSYQTDDWPVCREVPPPEVRAPVLISLDLEWTGPEFGRAAADLSALQAAPNLDPNTRYLLTALAAKCRAKADPKERW